MYEEEATYFVTARTIQGRLLIQQDERSMRLVAGILARASEKYEVDIHAYAVASNHLHILSTARDARQSRFMGYVLSNVARKLGFLADWEGPFWQRRFASEVVLGQKSEEGRLRYILSHGVKEGLVQKPSLWPGLAVSLRQLLGGLAEKFPVFNWARRWAKGKLLNPEMSRFDSKLADEVTLELKPLPSWRGFSKAKRARWVERMVHDIEEEHRASAEEVRGIPQPWKRGDGAPPPVKLKKTKEPWCHADTLEDFKGYLERYKAFAIAFAEASKQFLAGVLTVAFPPRAFRPVVWLPATN